MNINEVMAFLGWCTTINIGLLVYGLVMLKLFPNLTYRVQRAFVDISQEDFELVMYKSLAYFKLTIIVFNVTPYLVLRILYA